MASAIDNGAQSVSGARPSVEVGQALRRAARETGVDFNYLVETAYRESSFNPNLQASTSSATGLFQFIEQTWLATIKSDGARFGLSKEAASIQRNSDGRYYVQDQATRAEILALRKDPDVSAKLAGALAERNADYLTRTLGETPNGGALYIAHFLGAKGAADLISAKSANPAARAADLFPAAAKANKAIFYSKDGAARSVSEVHDVLVRHHDVTASRVSSLPSPEEVIGGHLPDRPSKHPSSSGGVALGPQAAFLASHFAGATSAFTTQDEDAGRAFTALFGDADPHRQPSFFAPERRADVLHSASSQEEADTIPSRYGRLEGDDGIRQQTNHDAAIETAIEAVGAQGGIDDPYPSVFKTKKTEGVTSPEFGKTDPPLDLSRFMKAYRRP